MGLRPRYRGALHAKRGGEIELTGFSDCLDKLRNRATENKATGNQALRREIGSEDTYWGFPSI